MAVADAVNFWGSVVCAAGAMLFVGVYSVMPFVTGRVPWWRVKIGRMMVTTAVSLLLLMLISIIFYLANLDIAWVRGVRGVLAAVVGVMMSYQAWLVYKLQSRREQP